MLIKGEKYACEACVRGHRVSNCQHADRPLQHINKKGRPVSQCTHCRTLRKARSAHVRCDCGEKAHTKGACPQDSEPQADTCCCSHGSRCSCALKKEHLDPVPESDSDEASSTSVPEPTIRRPRAHTSQSETGLTVFTNGHHKPVHKHNNMAHKCGLPYVVPRTHSIHGPSPSGLANRSVDNLPHTSTIDALHSESHIKDSIVSAQQEQRMVKSEHGSPVLTSTSNLEQLNGLLPPLDLSDLPNDYNFHNLDTFSSIPDLEQPLFSAGLSSASIDWSHYDGLDFNSDNFAASSYSQAPSFTGFDFSSIDQPALTTTSTSGEISEVEDSTSISNPATKRPTLLHHQYGSDFDTSASEFGDMDGYRLSTASSYIGLPQAHMLASANVGAVDMDSFLKGLPTAAYLENSNPLPIHSQNHGLPTYTESGKLAQPQYSDLDEVVTFPLLSTEEEAFWMADFIPGNSGDNGALNAGRGEMFGGDVWVQQ